VIIGQTSFKSVFRDLKSFLSIPYKCMVVGNNLQDEAAVFE